MINEEETPTPTPVPSPSFPALIDSSMLTSSSCPKKFFFQYCLNLAPYDISTHLHAGGVLADALRVTRMSYYHEKKDFKTAFLDGTRQFFLKWGEFEAPLGGSGSAKFKDFINVFAAFMSYFREYYPGSDYIQPYIKENGEPAVEFKFAIPLPIKHPVSGDPILYGGRSDLIGIYNSMQCIVDEKTTYAFSDNWSKPFQMRGQFIGYVWAAQQSGFDLNCAVARGIGIQQSAIKHCEAIMLYPQWQIDRWYVQMLKKVQNLINEFETWQSTNDLNSLSMSYGNECSSFNGCEMMDLCTSENPENWYSTFQLRNWDPLADV